MPAVLRSLSSGDSPLCSAPVSVGTGLVALDWLLIGSRRVRANQQYAGGSCGNVLTILAYLGWSSYPVARLGADRPAENLLRDLRAFRVQTDFVTKEDAGSTPVIVLRLSETDAGKYKSRFEWKHPQSGDWLPRYRPVPKSHAKRIAPNLPSARIFYFDRAQPSSLVMATAMRERGAVVFFEPSSIRDDALTSACVAVSDIVKYSADRIPNPPRNPVSKSPRLEIQTLGDSGLRYRVKMDATVPGQWRQLTALPVQNFKDSTGCGDWCSAGIIHKLCDVGRDRFMSLDETAIVDGIRFGMALATINCGYEGARGPMYHFSKDELLAEAERLPD